MKIPAAVVRDETTDFLRMVESGCDPFTAYHLKIMRLRRIYHTSKQGAIAYGLYNPAQNQPEQRSAHRIAALQRLGLLRR